LHQEKYGTYVSVISVSWTLQHRQVQRTVQTRCSLLPIFGHQLDPKPVDRHPPMMAHPNWFRREPPPARRTVPMEQSIARELRLSTQVATHENARHTKDAQRQRRRIDQTCINNESSEATRRQRHPGKKQRRPIRNQVKQEWTTDLPRQSSRPT